MASAAAMTTATDDASASASTRARGRRGAFAPRVPASAGRGTKDANARGGVDDGASGGFGADAEPLPSDLERLVKEAKARTTGGSRDDGGSSRVRAVRTAKDGDSARVAIGGGAAFAHAAAGPSAKVSGGRAKRGASAAAAKTVDRDVVVVEDPPVMVFPTSQRVAKKETPAANETTENDDGASSDGSSEDDEAEKMDVEDAPARARAARPTRVSKAKQAQLALEERSRMIQPERATTDEMYDAEEDWTDKTQYYPTVLNAASREKAPAAVAETVRGATGDRFMVLQLPSDLPLRKRDDDDVMEVDGVVEIGDEEDKIGAARMVRRTSELADGRLGELKIHADGSAKLYIGNAIFDVLQGTPYQHAEQVAQLDKANGNCVILGDSGARMVCVPDVTQLLL